MCTEHKDPSLLKGKTLNFCHEYAICGHGRNAATKAGFSAKTAAVKACQLLKRVDVNAKISELSAVVEKEKICSYAEACEVVTGFLRDEKSKSGTRMNAVNLLGKMRGWHDVKPEDHKPVEITISYKT